MEIKHTYARDLTPTYWPHGITTELAIFPEGASLPKRDFTVRVSVAKDQESGDFSDFTGFIRHLMLLSGEGMELKTADGEIFCLDRVFDHCTFPGKAGTYCRLLEGAVTDFNIILGPNTFAKMEALNVRTTLGYPLPNSRDVAAAIPERLTETVDFFYCWDGLVCAEFEGELYELSPGDVLQIERKVGEDSVGSVHFNAKQASIISANIIF